MSRQKSTSDLTLPEEPFFDRFQEVLRAIGALQTAASITDYSTEQIAKWRDGKARPPLWPVVRLARAANRSLDWLVGNDPSNTVVSQDFHLATDDDGENVASIPLLDVIASAGPGIENPFPLEIDRLPFPRRWLADLGLPEHYARFLGARGDSMEPTILDGAICLADIRFQVPRIDGVYAVIDGNDVRIKRIARGWMGSIMLISDNERYESETLAPPDAEALRVAGKIVWAGGKI